MVNVLSLAISIILGIIVILLIVIIVSKKRNAIPLIKVSSEAPPFTSKREKMGRPRDKDVYDKCCDYMSRTKAFLVQDFRLEDLTRAVYMNSTYLSRAVNRYYGDFRVWVNEYRINYAKEVFLRNPSLRVIELASLCGFKSVSTFNISFKMFNGVSPSIWCKKIKLEVESGARRKELAKQLQSARPSRGGRR